MKNIHEILTEIGVEVPEEKKADFDKAFGENYKTIADYQKQKDKLDKATADIENANKNIKELNDTIKNYEGTDDTIKTLQEKVTAYEQAEADRVQAEKDRKADEEMNARIAETIGDVEFINEFTKNSIYQAIKDGVKADSTKGVKSIFEELTKDKEGIFKNPQDPMNLPKGGNFPPSSFENDNKLRRIMGLEAKGE